MARSNGRAAVAALLGALCYALLSELSAFVNAASGRNLRSRVSLAATQAEVDAAKKDFELKKWAAGRLEGSAQAAAAVARAQQAEAAYAALKAQLQGMPPPAAPVAAAPVATAAPVVAAVTAPASAVSKEALAAAKQSAQLLTWAANKLASEGAPQAAAMKAKADQAVAAFEAMKQAQASGAAVPVMPAAVAVPIAAPVAAAAPAAAAAAVSKADLAAAKQSAQLLTWAANKLASEGAPQAAAMKAKADQAVAAFEALKQAEASGAAAPAVAAAPAPVAAAPVAAAPVAAAPTVASSAAPSAADVEKAKKEMELHAWAAEKLAASGSLQAAVMRAKAEQSRQAYEALKEKQLVAR